MADEVSGTHNNYTGQALLTALTDESVAAIGAASGGGGGTQDVSVVDPLPAGTNNIGDVDVLSVAGVTQLPAALGQKTAANSLSITLPSDQGAIPGSIANGADVALGSTTDAAVSTDANGTVSAKLRGLVVLFVNYLSRFPTSLGQKTTANSLPVTLPSDQGALPGSVADGADVTLGAKADAAASSDAGTFSLVALFKRLLGKLPAALGQQTRANSLSVTQSSDATGVNAPEFKQTNGANIQDIIAPASGQNSALIAGSHMTVSASTTIAQAIASTDAGNYAWVSVHILTQGTSSTITFQASNDNVNWLAVRLIPTGSGNLGLATSATSANLIYQGPLTARYFRLNVTGISAGTTSAVVSFSTQPKGIIGIEADVNITRIANSAAGSGGDARVITTLFPALQHVSNGATADARRLANLAKGFDAVDVAAEVAILTPTAGKKLRPLGLALSSSVAGNIVLREGTAGRIVAVVPSAAGGAAPFIPLGNGTLFAAINTALTADGPAGSLLSGTITYVEE